MRKNKLRKVRTYSIVLTLIGVVFLPGGTGHRGVAPLRAVMAQSVAKPQQSPSTRTPPPAPELPAVVDFKPDKDQAWTMRLREHGNILELHIRGQIHFTRDSKNIQSISRNGYFHLEELRGSERRIYEARSDDDGQLRTKYEVQGVERPMDAQAQAWLGEMLLEVVRQSALDVEARVHNLISSGGAGAVLDEIPQLTTDYSKSRYLDELVRDEKLDRATLARVEQQLARQVKDDYYKARVLISIAGLYLDADANLAAFFETVSTLSNDYYKAQVLGAVLKKDKLSRAALAGTLESAALISSEYEKAGVMCKIAANASVDNALRANLVDAAMAINSEYFRNRVLAMVALQNNRD